MNHLLHRVHSTALAIVLLGLSCLPLPARAAQTDYADFEEKLAAVESNLPELEEISSKYLAGEAELALHLAAVKREETKIQRNYAEYKSLLGSWVYIGKLDPKKTGSIMNQTQQQTKELRSALADWRQQVQQARQTQDEICANKARIDSGSPRQIAQWKESGSKLLVTHTTQLREKRKVLTVAWSGLNSVSSELTIRLGRMEGFLAKKEAYQRAYSRMKALADTSVTTCRELEKDLSRAGELKDRLKNLQNEILRFKRVLLPELKEMKRQIDTETDFLSNTDRSNLKKRLDSALAKLESTTLSPVPEIPELDSRCKTFIDASDRLDSSGMIANLQQLESLSSDARSVLSKARDVLKEASSAQAGFGGLGKARKCLDVLRRARTDAEKTDVDEVFSLVEGLQTRLEEAERQEHIFATRNRENQVRTEEMKSLMKDARLIFDTLDQFDQELRDRLGPLEPDKAIQDLEKLLSVLEREEKELEKSNKELTKTIQDAEQKRRSICDRVVKAGSVPLPSSDELKTWHQEATSDTNRMRQTLEAASRKVHIHVGLVAEQVQKVTASRDKSSAVRDKLLLELKNVTYFHVQMTQAQDGIKDAIDIWGQVTREGKALESRRKANLKELKRIQDIAAELAPRVLNNATITELKTIEARAAALAGRYPPSTVVDERDNPESSGWAARAGLPRANLDKLARVSRAPIERQLSKINELIKKAGIALEQAESVRKASARERSLFPDILAKADKCVSELATKLSAGRKLEAELRTMVDNANALYQECRFNKVMPILTEALAKAKSEKHQKSIKDKIKLTERRQKYEKTTIILYNDADALYKKGKYSDALNKLRQARKHTSCQRFKDSLDKKIAMVQGKFDSQESMEEQGRQDVAQERQQTQQAASCATLARQLRIQVEEIRKQVQHYINLKDANPPLPRSRTGPIACKVAEAEKRYQNIWMQAKNANCTEATRIKHPYGISTGPIRLECWRYSGSP